MRWVSGFRLTRAPSLRQFEIRKRLQGQAFPLVVVVVLGFAVSLLMASLPLLADAVDTVSAQQQDSSQDLTLHSDNGAPRGIWSDGSTMWVADFSDRKVYAYDLADESRLEGKDIDLGSSNFKALGLWSDGTTIWALNTRDYKIYGYSLADGSREDTKDITLDGENDTPTGIWSDASTMYVVDQNDRKLYAYALHDGARQSDKDITIPIDRPRPIGVWSNSSTFWISYDHHQDYSEDDDRRLYAFSLEDGARDEESDVQISTDPNSRSSGIWSNGTTIWVTDKFYRKILAYQIPQPAPSSDATLIGLGLSAGSLSPSFSSTTTSYTASVAYEITEVTLNATSSDSSARVLFLDANDSDLADADPLEPGYQVTLAVNENAIKIRVTAEDEINVQTYLVTVTRGRADVSISSRQDDVIEGETAELEVVRATAIPEPLDVNLSVSETESLLPTLEEGSRTVTIPSGTTSTAFLLTTDTDDDEWEDHSTATISILEDDAYRITDTASSTSVRLLDDDFPPATAVLSVSPNPVTEGAMAMATIAITTLADRQPHGSGGSLTLSQSADTADASDFTMLNQTSFDVSADDFSLTSVGGDTRYRADYAATMSAVEDSIVEVGESFEIEVSKDTGSKDSLTLAQPSAVTVSILDNDAALSSLDLSGVTITPEFSSRVYRYNAHVYYTLEETTVAASAGHSDSAGPTVRLGGLVDSDGTLSLEVGENEITIEVTAEDATSGETYIINVTRAGPKVSIGAIAAEVGEGQVVEFRISRDAVVSESLDVDLTLSESGGLVPDADLGSRTVTIPGAATSTTTAVSTHPDDDLWEPHSVVTATVSNNETIEIVSGAGTASTQVNDNDFPEATADLDVAPNPVSEGATVSATLTITTKMEEEPHGKGGTLTLAARANTAQPADYGRFGNTSFQVAPGDFDLVEVGGDSRYRASYTAAVAITDDSDSESDESFYIEATKSDAPQIEFPASATTSVVIVANDSSTDPTLSQLSLSTGTLSPVFSNGTTMYSADLAHGIQQVTVRPIVNSDNSEVAFLDNSNNELPDANSSEDGHQVDLEVGANVVNVKVTAEDGITTETYTIVLTRGKPEVSIHSKNVEVTEGTNIVFTLVRTTAATEGLEVKVDVGETGSLVADIEEGSRTVVIPTSSTSTSITVTSDHNDRDWENHSTVNGTIATSDAYIIRQSMGRAETLVKDDDFPEALASLSANPTAVTEGAISTLSITVTSTYDQDPHGPGGALTLTTVGGTALDEDYRSLSQTAFNVEAADFSRVDIGSGSMAYRAVYTASVETTDDGESEPDETVVFRLGRNTNSEKIRIEGSATATVTILANDASSDASLSGIGLSDGTLSPPFASSTTSYTASVSHDVEYVSLDPVKSDSGAKIKILDGGNSVLDDANMAPGFQVDLAVGASVIKLEVAAEDDNTMKTYVITITRSKPVIGIVGDTSEVSEGEGIVFHVSRDASVSDSLPVTVEIAETDMLLAAGERGQRTITIPPVATSTSFVLAGDTDDVIWEEHSTVTASIVQSPTYDIASDRGRSHVQIEDNDFPEASAVLELTPNPVMEGESLAAQVIVTTTAAQQPHGDGGTLLLNVTGGTAQADDFELPHEVEFDIAAADFVPVIVSGAARYRANYSAATTITDDDDAEHSETLGIAISKRDSDRITLPVPSTFTVTIAPSDLSVDAGLNSLAVSEGTLIPHFASSTTNYAVSVGFGVKRITVTPTASDISATISIDKTDVLSGQSYFADLVVGTSTIHVVVTAQDSATTRIYSVNVVRARPEVSISPVLPEVLEGDTVNFTVSRSAAVSEPLGLQVEVTESGDLVPDDGEGARLVTVPTGATSTILTVQTDIDDETWEEHSGVTAALIADDGYLVKPNVGIAEVSVRDDDFPEATASLTVSPNPVAEGETVTVTATVVTRANEQPHRSGGPLKLAIEVGTAQLDDHGSLTQSTFSIGEADFVVDNSSNTYISEYFATIDVTEDSEVETGENFDVSLSLSSDSPASLTLELPDSVTVHINDLSVGLVELDLDGVILSPQFSSDTLNYTGFVPYSVVETVVSATTTEASSGSPSINLKGAPVSDGRIPLSIGDNPITIEVMSDNSSDMRTYKITITREKPEVSVAASLRQSTEGGVLGYTVARSTPAPDILEVQVEVVEDGEMVPDTSQAEGNRSIVIPAGATSTTFAIETEMDDEIWEDHSNVTVTVKDSGLYLIRAGERVAATLIRDNDFPESIATLSVAPPSVIEGGSVTLSVAVTTIRDETPHTDGGLLTVVTANDSAIGGVDHIDLSSVDGTLSFVKSEFVQVDVSGQTCYQAMKLLNIETLRDSDQEGVEKFAVILEKVTTGPTPTSSQIVLDASSQMLTVTIEDGPDAELTSLTLSEGTLAPPFGTSTRRYSAEVSYGIERVTLIATKSRDSTSVTFHDGNDDNIADLDDTTDGHQMSLAVGENIIKIRVSEDDSTVLDTYTITVTRIKPVVSITSTTTSVSEGESAVFVVRRDHAPSEPLRVTLSVTETSSMLNDALKGGATSSVSIPGYATSTNLVVITDPDDNLWEEHSIAAASVVSHDTYAITADSGRSEIQITDNDFPEAVASLAVAPNPVSEGSEVTAVVTVSTLRDQRPHSNAGSVQLALVGTSATSGSDFTPPMEDRITFMLGDFKAVDVNGQTRHWAAKQLSVSIVDDAEFEGLETFTIEIIPVTGGPTSTASQITFDPNESLREVSITDNDDEQTGGGGGTDDDPQNADDPQSSGTVGASNRGGGGGSNRAAPNQKPKFEEGGETRRSIVENSAIGTRIGDRVRAIYRGSGRLKYTLRGDDRSSFTINESTGRLYTAVTLDREVDSRYYLTVAVSNDRGGTDAIEVIIVIKDEDEAPSITGDQRVTILEQTPDVLSVYAANDPENGEIHWTMSGLDSASFEIEEGALAFRTPPDFEDPADANRDNSYEVTVRASDGVHTSTLDIVVTVADLDESPSPTPTPMPTSYPTSTPEPVPAPTHVPTVTLTARPTSTSIPLPTQTPVPQPTVTPTPVSTAEATPRAIDTPTPVPTTSPTPGLLPLQKVPLTLMPIRESSPETEASAKLQNPEQPTTAHEPTALSMLLIVSATPSATPPAIVVSTEAGSVPAWLMLSITFWAILATGVGVYVYLQHR